MRFNLMTTFLSATAFICFAATDLQANTIISGQFYDSAALNGAATIYSGVEPDAATADSQFHNSNIWNGLGISYYFAGGAVSFSNLVASTGANTGAGLIISEVNGAYNGTPALPDTYAFAYSPSTFTFSGLPSDQGFTLFLYCYDELGNREEVFTVGASSFDTANGNPSSEDPVSAVTGIITGVTSATGTISGTWAAGSSNNSLSPEIDWSGFQLDIASPTATPEPAAFALFGLGLFVLGAACKWLPRIRA